VAAREAAASTRHRERRLNADYRGLAEWIDLIDPPGFRFDFRLGVPEIAPLALDVWGRLSNRSLRSLARHEAGYASPAGEPALRAAIAVHVSPTRADPWAPRSTANSCAQFGSPSVSISDCTTLPERGRRLCLSAASGAPHHATS
jgi:DNA-binding transcriptional MocR family regulator